MKDYCEICGYKFKEILMSITADDLTDNERMHRELTVCPNCQQAINYVSNLYGFFDFDDERFIQKIRDMTSILGDRQIKIISNINNVPFYFYSDLLIKE